MLCCPFQALPRCSPVVSQAAAEPPQPQLSEREQGRAICGCACSPNQAPPKPRGQDPALHPHQELWSLCRSSGGSWCLGRFCWSPASNSLSLVTSLQPRPLWMEPKTLGAAKPWFSWPDSLAKVWDRGCTQVMALPYQPCSPSQHFFKLSLQELSCPNCTVLYLQR